MASIGEQIRSQFQQANWLNRIIYVNIGLFAILIIGQAIFSLAKIDFINTVGPFLAMPSNSLELLTRPWTIITYMFVHYGFFHILFNMLILFFSGRIFVEFMGDKRVLPVYIYGGLAGAILFFILFNISPALAAGSPMIGASAGVMAVVIAAASKAPNLPVRLFFVLEVKFWIVAVGLIFIDFLNFQDGNTGGHIAHLGGSAVGYLYIQSLNKGRDWSNGFWNFIRRFEGLFKRKPKMRTVHRSNTRTRPSKKQNTTSGSDQAKMDEILDKIKDKGYDKLSKEEKDFLFKFSRK